jgi:major membrane immunogen (membrane-anchored lipoprotein)
VKVSAEFSVAREVFMLLYKIISFFATILLIVGVLYFSPASTQRYGLRDGYYTAEVSSYNHGWKEFLTIYVNDGKIITAEYNARNASGLIKSWDMEYMRDMNRTDHNYPNKYTRAYASALVEKQSTIGIDAMSGATESYHSFMLLAEAAIDSAKSGDNRVAYVTVPDEEH